MAKRFYLSYAGKDVMHSRQFGHQSPARLFSLKRNCLRFSRKPLLLLDRQSSGLSSDITGRLRGRCFEAKAASADSLTYEQFLPKHNDGEDVVMSHDSGGHESLQPRPKAFRNRFLNFARLGSVLNNIAESFFKSEIRRRLFVTALLIVLSRIGYFIPLPGFDRRLIPEDYLSFVSGSAGKAWFFYHMCTVSLYCLSYNEVPTSKLIILSFFFCR